MKKRQHLFYTCCLPSVLLLFNVTLASDCIAKEIYRYTDSKGLIHFTDVPPKRNAAQTAKVKASTKTTGKAFRIYKFVDSLGIVHLTDTPKDNRYELIYEGPSNIQNLYYNQLGVTYAPKTIISKYQDYKDLVNQIAAQTQLEPELLHAVIHAESAYNPNAVSPKGAVGLMQLMPATAARYGVSDRTDPADNMAGGARYLKDLLEMFQYNKQLAIAAYNAGENAVIKYGNQIPPYKETRGYVTRVLGLYDAYRNM
ncbi:lytic transglycosylase domain-containing protein [Beggiatoa leptomitoformis]|uniref:Transglycosylase SLT domain-containing protein n=1 Tax=Beggiatoa leptomitoformis TaxID=288004 RepID=A0A2N9YHI9_9GAMM|nr:lytic transglycosylase domain-containing protein [Beggiatoa leptomitoformis]ALG69407.2 transglycosylase SLT domain-containing protein [Beggiatoa leptomitoformis]AUI69998.1 transglycosylase SLT domain-containing protein [Beggiatoa leptomitoformis]